MCEMKDSGVAWIGKIPHSWNVVRNKGLIFEVNERCEADTDLPLLSVSEYYGIAPKAEKIADGDFISRAESLKDYKICHVDDVVINIMLAWKRAQGVSNFNGIVSPAYCVYRKKENAPINMAYYHYLIRSDLYISVFKRYSTGIIDSRLRLYPDKFLALYSHVPPLEDQQKIAAHLDRKCTQIDALISNAQQQIEKLKAYKQSVITETVTKGLDPDVTMKDSGVEWIGEIPEHWGTPQIKHIATISSGSTPNRNNTEYWNGSIKWLKTGELQNNEITDSEEHITQKALEETSVTLFPVNTVLMAMYGQGKTRGMTALLKTPSTTNQACAGMTIVSQNILVKYFWKCLMGAYNGIREIAQGSGQPNLNAGLISSFKIPLPPKEEQQPIIDFLDKKCSQIDKLIALKQQKIEKLQQYKKSLIYEYVTGKKGVE